MLPVDFELITTVPAFVVSASATKSETLFAVTDPPVTTKSSPVVKSLITSDPALILKVSLPAPPVRSSSFAPPVMTSLPVPAEIISSPPAPVIISL